MNMTAEKLHHIVIVGGGAGGLELATSLGDSLGRKNKAVITLIDSGRTHVWKDVIECRAPQGVFGHYRLLILRREPTMCIQNLI